VSRRRLRPYDVHRTCRRCGGPLKAVADGDYARCARCGAAEWRPRLEPLAREPQTRKETT
jgi:NADH pyrophosphatase NudC (nudix superfamily)